MAYSALNVAKHIVKTSQEALNPVPNLKLQKLLYFAWIEYYKASGQYLFKNRIEAWQCGVIIPDVYYEYYVYAAIPIRENKVPSECLDKTAVQICQTLIEENQSTSAVYLTKKIHQSGTPWHTVYSCGKKQIPFELIIKKECGAD